MAKVANSESIDHHETLPPNTTWEREELIFVFIEQIFLKVSKQINSELLNKGTKLT